MVCHYTLIFLLFLLVGLILDRFKIEILGARMLSLLEFQDKQVQILLESNHGLVLGPQWRVRILLLLLISLYGART